jgi:cellulose synthase (UDP-forming)
MIVLNWISRGVLIPIIYDVSQVVLAWPLTRASIAGLMPTGPKSFKVTDKGGDRSSTVVRWQFLRLFAALFALTLGGLALPLVSDHTYSQAAGDGRLVILSWSIYNLIVLALAMAVCFEQPRHAHPMNFAPEPAGLWDGETFVAGWVFEMSADRAVLRGPSGLAAGSDTALQLPGIGIVPAIVTEETATGYVLKLLPSPEQRGEILVRLHTVSRMPGATSGKITGIAAGLARLIAPKTSY